MAGRSAGSATGPDPQHRRLRCADVAAAISRPSDAGWPAALHAHPDQRRCFWGGLRPLH